MNCFRARRFHIEVEMRLVLIQRVKSETHTVLLHSDKDRHIAGRNSDHPESSGWSELRPAQLKMVDGHLIGEVNKLRYLSNCNTDFIEIWHGDSYWLPDKYFCMKTPSGLALQQQCGIL